MRQEALKKVFSIAVKARTFRSWQEASEARLRHGSPAGQDHGCGQPRKGGLGGQLDGWGPHGPLDVCPQREQGQWSHTGQRNQESKTGEEDREEPEDPGDAAKQDERTELSGILLLAEETAKGGSAQEEEQRPKTQTDPREAGAQQPSQGHGKAKHEPAAMFGREEAAQGRKGSGHFGIQYPKSSLTWLSA